MLNRLKRIVNKNGSSALLGGIEFGDRFNDNG